MKVLVTGAGGFLGRHTVGALLRRGYEVRALLRSEEQAKVLPKAADVMIGDIRRASDCDLVLKDVECVVHLAAAVSGGEDQQFASTVIATEVFLSALRRNPVKHMVHVSSIAVYDWAGTTTEMTEVSPLSPSIYDMGAYSIAKFWQEKIILEFALDTGLHLTILRPGFIWGEDHAKIAGMGRSIGRLHLVFGPMTRLPLTYVENCADCISVAASREPQTPEVFNVFDDDRVTTWAYSGDCFNAMKERHLRIPVPYYAGMFVAQLAALTSKLLFGPAGRLPSLLVPRRYEAQFKPLRYSTRKLRDELQWHPPFEYAECWRRTASRPLQGGRA